MKKAIAEFIGTFTLVLFGCGAAMIAAGSIGAVDGVGLLGISFAFGLALISMAYGIGPISGCHINPAVSLAALIAGRMEITDFGLYVVAQLAGALAGAFVLMLIMQGQIQPGWTGGLGSNGWGVGYLGEFNMTAALIFEVVATFLFCVTILGVTQPGAPSQLAGLAIGLALVVIHIVGIKVTGVSVNPARSFGPALLEGGRALEQLWLFIVAPLVGAAAAGFMFASGALDAELD